MIPVCFEPGTSLAVLDRRVALLATGAAVGLAACGADGGSSSAPDSSERSREDRSFAACLKRSGARLVRARADVAFLRGTSTESDGELAVTNGIVAGGRGAVEVEWMTRNGSARWRVYSRSHETETASPDYEGIWKRVVDASPDVAVIAVKRTGSRASFTAARRCIGTA